MLCFQPAHTSKGTMKTFGPCRYCDHGSTTGGVPGCEVPECGFTFLSKEKVLRQGFSNVKNHLEHMLNPRLLGPP